MIIIKFEGNEFKIHVGHLNILRLPYERIQDLSIEFVGGQNVLGINFKNDYKYLDHIFAVKFFTDRKSPGQSTVEYILERSSKYSLIILDPGGFDQNSIEYVIDQLSEYPLLLFLDSATYFSIFEDYTFDVKDFRDLKRREVFSLDKFKRKID
jgi:hypothetical protein